MGQAEWLKNWEGGCQNSDRDGLKILDLLMFILLKAQYAMTIGHCRMQPGVEGALIP